MSTAEMQEIIYFLVIATKNSYHLKPDDPLKKQKTNNEHHLTSSDLLSHLCLIGSSCRKH